MVAYDRVPPISSAGKGGAGCITSTNSIVKINIGYINTDINALTPVSSAIEELKYIVQEKKISPINCINCGAPMSSKASKCEYCDTYYK